MTDTKNKARPLLNLDSQISAGLAETLNNENPDHLRQALQAMYKAGYTHGETTEPDANMNPNRIQMVAKCQGK